MRKLAPGAGGEEGDRRIANGDGVDRLQDHGYQARKKADAGERVRAARRIQESAAAVLSESFLGIELTKKY